MLWSKVDRPSSVKVRHDAVDDPLRCRICRFDSGRW
nr:MAG TPA: hypothetical protein [Caudoviricetes sp.]